MATQLQFKKVASLPEQLEKGTVYFNSTTHSIFVAKTDTTTDEFGGRLKDVNYNSENKKLTIEKYTNNGVETQELSFADIASAESVENALAAITTRLNTLEGVINDTTDTEGTVTKKGLSSRVKDIEGEVSDLNKSVNTLNNDIYDTEDKNGNTVKGIKTIVTETASALANKADITGNSANQFNVAYPSEKTHAANKQYVDEKITSTYKVKGSVADKTALSNLTNLSNGDVYNVTAEVTIDATDVATKKFITAGTYPAGSNWVWIEHENDDPHPSHWDAIGGMITGYATDDQVTDISTRVTRLENGENTVKTFGGQSGIINIKTAEATDANGTVQFTVEKTSTSNNVVTSNLTATVKGIANAAFKAVDEYNETNKMTYVPNGSTNVPTSNLVYASLSSLYSTVTTEIKNNSTMTWAEWPTS